MEYLEKHKAIFDNLLQITHCCCSAFRHDTTFLTAKFQIENSTDSKLKYCKTIWVD